MLVLTVPEWKFFAERRQHQHAALVLRSERFEADTVSTVARRIVTHDPDGGITGVRQEAITLDHGRQLLTVLRVEDVSVFMPEGAVDGMRALNFHDAQACSYKTLEALRDVWKTRHPRSELAQLVWFVIGDWRDRDIYLQWTGRGGGDYTRNPHRAIDSDAPALTKADYEGLGMIARQQEAKKRARTTIRQAAKPDHVRVAEAQAAMRELEAQFKRDVAALASHVARGERYAAALRASP